MMTKHRAVIKYELREDKRVTVTSEWLETEDMATEILEELTPLHDKNAKWYDGYIETKYSTGLSSNR